MKLRPWHIGLALSASSKNTIAAMVTTATAGAVTLEFGVDPWPWILGGMACTVVHAYKPPSTRPKALANAVICVFIGGVLAPWLVGLPFVAEWVGTRPAAGYVASFMLAATWPWTAPVLFDKIKSVLAALSFSKGAKDV